jgi:hypothetical protein
VASLCHYLGASVEPEVANVEDLRTVEEGVFPLTDLNITFPLKATKCFSFEFLGINIEHFGQGSDSQNTFLTDKNRSASSLSKRILKIEVIGGIDAIRKFFSGGAGK